MIRTRLIPVLLVDHHSQLVQTTSFDHRHYLGDPLNAAYVFSGFEVDELIVLDIDATAQSRSITFPFVNSLAQFTSVPLTVGGGINHIEQIQTITSLGVEKVALSASLNRDFSFLDAAASRFGSSTITVILNVRKVANEYLAWLGRPDAPDAGPGRSLSQLAFECQQHGAGEIIVQSVDRDGMRTGLDISLYTQLNESLTIPIVALGGCNDPSSIHDLLESTQLSAVAAGSLFSYAPGSSEVLLNYPSIL